MVFLAMLGILQNCEEVGIVILLTWYVKQNGNGSKSVQSNKRTFLSVISSFYARSSICVCTYMVCRWLFVFALKHLQHCVSDDGHS